MAIQSNETVHSYADSIVSASNSVSLAIGTKDDGNVYQGQAGMTSNIDKDKNIGEQAKERAIDFIQVLHGIHAEFQTTDASIAGYINSHTGTGSEALYSSAKR